MAGNKGEARAPRACISCTKQKRRCDKVLPSCSLCRRMDRECNYGYSSANFNELQMLQNRVIDLEQRLEQADASSAMHTRGWEDFTRNGSMYPEPATFPSLFFLDSNAFEYQGRSYTRPKIQAPAAVSEMLGSPDDIQRMVDNYFSTVHKWLPMISKIRLRNYLSTQEALWAAEHVLLLLCMKLSIEVPTDSPQSAPTSLYRTAKSYLSAVQCQSIISVHVVQAAILIAAYEVGHGLYPAAYLSVGHCVTLGHATGLSRRDAPQMLPKPHTICEQEERRRIWWSILLLERYVNLGNRRHPLMSEDPSLGEFLPVDDSLWDEGTHSANDSLVLSTITDIHTAAFARVCQATHLLGRVIRHANDKNVNAFRFEEAMQIERTIRAFAAILTSEMNQDQPFQEKSPWTALALCKSILILLYDEYSCTVSWNRGTETVIDGQTEMQKIAIDGTREFVVGSTHFTRMLTGFIQLNGIDTVGPFVTDICYAAAATCVYYVRENGDAEATSSLIEIKALLKMLAARWKVASVYLEEISRDESTKFEDG